MQNQVRLHRIISNFTILKLGKPVPVTHLNDAQSARGELPGFYISHAKGVLLVFLFCDCSIRDVCYFGGIVVRQYASSLLGSYTQQE